MTSQRVDSLSFELFPPKNAVGFEQLQHTCAQLQEYQPDYFSVTFGAGGSNQEKTFAVVDSLNEQSITVAPHLTCMGLTKRNIKVILERYHQSNIKNLVVIRGDLPEETQQNSGDFHYASELLHFIREQFGNHFNIKVAAYPEFHPQAANAWQDVEHFRNKIAAGADSAITQFFFNFEAYYYFLDTCQQQNITIPIVPGIIPISNFARLCHFAELCGAEIPLWIKKRVIAYGDDETSIQQFGIDVVTNLCYDLLALDVPGLHFYTLNHTDPTRQILINLGFEKKKDDTARGASLIT